MLRSKSDIWLTAVRPKTLPAVIVPVLVGSAFAFHDAKFSFLALTLALLFGLAVQVTTNFANDLFDYIKGADTDKRRGPIRVTQAGLVTVSEMKQALAIVICFAALIGLGLILQGGIPILFIVAVSILLAVLYTGGPYPLAYLGLGDIFVFIFFGPVALGATYYLHTGALTPELLAAGSALGMISTAILAVNNIRDHDADRNAFKKTLVVRFGLTFGRLEYAALLLGAGLLPILSNSLRQRHPGTMLAAVFLVFSIPVIKRVLSTNDSETLNQALANTGELLMLYGFFFSLGLLLF